MAKSDPKKRSYGRFDWTDPKTGYLYARVIVTGANGKKKTLYKRAKNITHAKQLATELKAEHEDRGQAFIDSKEMRLQDVAEWYKSTFVIEPVYKDGAKVAGLRTWQSERRKIDRIFGIGDVDREQASIPNVLASDLDEDLLRKFKLARLRSVGVTAVNRDLETVRAMLRQAKRKKWLKDVPDFAGLIEKSLENRRSVTVTTEQEKAILAAAATVSRSPRLTALILALRDSGARPNELYPVNDYTADKTLYEPLRWRDVMRDGEIVEVTTIVSLKNRKREERLCVISKRLKAALEDLWTYLQERDGRLIEDHRAKLDNFIWPNTSFQSAWEVVRIAAGVPDLRLRDLRRDWVTRLGKLGFSDKIAQRAAGHKTFQQNYDYTEFDMQAAMIAKEMLDRDNDGPLISDAVN